MSKTYIGKVIDNYRILESLGIGGMGVVFKAINTQLDKLVALKMIAPGLAMNEDFIKRFQKEAKALAKLADPNIVSIFDLRQENDQWYIVMEYIDGPNLSDMIKKKKGLSTFESISILKQILNAIGHAHQANIVHRDIKPNNVMLNTDGIVKITDFGLSKDQSNAGNTVTVQSGGTLFYMSPEHVKGFSFTDKRSDIYSIGMTFYEMVTGNVPFQNMDTDFDIRESIVRKDFIKPSHYNPKIPKQLEAIIMKSIAKLPEDRYQSAEEMLKDILKLEKSLKGTAVLKEHPVQPVYKKKKPASGTRSPFKSKIIYPTAAILISIALIFAFNQKDETKKEEQQDIAEKVELVVEEQPEIQKIENEDAPNKPVQKIATQEENNKPTTIKKAATKPSTGTIFVTSEPQGTKIYINGRYKGETPFTIFGVKAGQNELTLRNDGYEELSENIEIKKGEKYIVNKVLNPLTGDLIVTYNPENSIIKLDGKIISEKSNPLSISQLSVGTHSLEITKAGYSKYSNNLDIKHQQTAKINATLTELIGKLSVRVKPWGSIYIDNQIQKANTDIKFEKALAEKSYNLKIVHPSFGEWEKEISIKHNIEEKVVVDFTKKVTIQVNALDANNKPITAKIIVDNKPTNFTTPENIKVRPGIHTFIVEKDGFIAMEDRKEFLVDNQFNKPITFVMKKIE